MAYVRKTKDEYIVQGNYGYGHGFEDECTEETRKEAVEFDEWVKLMQDDRIGHWDCDSDITMCEVTVLMSDFIYRVDSGDNV